MNINTHLCDDLFFNKKVCCDNQIYLELFDAIFPDADSFVRFLMVDSEIASMSYAISILETLNYSMDIPAPLESYKLLNKYQILQTARTPAEHKEPDHIVHSVYLYILGIYIFFNHEFFHDQLIRQFEFINKDSRNEIKKNSILMFVNAWKSFAIFHDIGYILEGLVNKDYKINNDEGKNVVGKLKDIKKGFLTHITCRILSEYFTFSALLSFSPRLFEDWYQIYGNELKTFQPLSHNGPSLVERINEFTKNTQNTKIQAVPIISSSNGIIGFSRILSHCAFVCIAKDHDLRVRALLLKEGAKTEPNMWVCETDVQKCSDISADRFFSFSYFEHEHWEYEIFIKDFIGSVSELFSVKGTTKLQSNFINSAITISERYKPYLLSTVSDSGLFRVKYNIYKDCVKLCSEAVTNRPENKSINQKLEDYIHKFVSDCLSRDMKVPLYHLDKEDMETLIKDLQKTIQEIDIDAALSALPMSKDMSNATANEISKLLALVKTRVNTFLGAEIPFVTERNGEYTVFPFHKSDADIECTVLLDKINEMLQTEGFLTKINDMQTLLQYKLSHSPYDHGIISGSLLFLIVQYAMRFMKSEHAFLQMYWNENLNCRKDVDAICYINSLVINAIIVHNIYPKEYGVLTGLNTMLNLHSNVFAYFCTLLDNLQIWDRPFAVDVSNLTLPAAERRNMFDIQIDHNKIKIYCASSQLEAIVKRFKQEPNDFLARGSEIIQIESLREKDYSVNGHDLS